jgi:hypothetical protein
MYIIALCCPPEIAAKRLAECIEVIHVYGSLGPLPGLDALSPDWAKPTQSEDDGATGSVIKYGSDTLEDYSDAGAYVRIFGRGAEEVRRQVQELVQQASVLVFLGFGFQDENTDLIGLRTLVNRRILSTGYGLREGFKFKLSRLSLDRGRCYWHFGGPDTKVGDYLMETDLMGTLHLGVQHCEAFASRYYFGGG